MVVCNRSPGVELAAVCFASSLLAPSLPCGFWGHIGVQSVRRSRPRKRRTAPVVAVYLAASGPEPLSRSGAELGRPNPLVDRPGRSGLSFSCESTGSRNSFRMQVLLRGVRGIVLQA